MSKKIIIAIIVLIAVGISAILLSKSPSSVSAPTISQDQPTTQTDNQKTFTAAEVARHANAQSCYTIVNGTVYDLTTWISRHPGGEQAILSICGKDGTFAFEGKHGENQRAKDALEKFLIGTVQQQRK